MNPEKTAEHVKPPYQDQAPPNVPTVEQLDREPTGYCRPDGHVWTIQPGRSYETCFWCDVIRT